MVALNEQLQHCGVPISDGHMSLNVIDGCDFTKRSGEVHGGPVVNFGVSGFCGLSDASPLRRRCAAPPNQSDPETQLYYVRNRTYNPTLGRWVQRDPIGYFGGIDLYEYVNGRAATALGPMGTDPGGKQCCGAKSNRCGPDLTAKLIALAGVINRAWNALSAPQKIELSGKTIVSPTALQAWDTSLVGTGINAMPCGAGTGECENTVTVSGKCYWQPAVNYWLAGLIFTEFNTLAFEPFAKICNAEVVGQTCVLKPLDHPRWKLDWYDAGMTSVPSNVPEPNIYSSCRPCKTKAATLTWKWGFLNGSI
jgi:RHS repeat-associated protein